MASNAFGEFNCTTVIRQWLLHTCQYLPPFHGRKFGGIVTPTLKRGATCCARSASESQIQLHRDCSSFANFPAQLRVCFCHRLHKRGYIDLNSPNGIVKKQHKWPARIVILAGKIRNHCLPGQNFDNRRLAIYRSTHPDP